MYVIIHILGKPVWYATKLKAEQLGFFISGNLEKVQAKRRSACCYFHKLVMYSLCYYHSRFSTRLVVQKKKKKSSLCWRVYQGSQI